ncbi:hypothetical protein P4132_05155, partial [Pseudomonas aeruginosa]|nr:hypothetical protein [Pseudomonas aeruginosa]
MDRWGARALVCRGRRATQCLASLALARAIPAVRAARRTSPMRRPRRLVRRGWHPRTRLHRQPRPGAHPQLRRLVAGLLEALLRAAGAAPAGAAQAAPGQAWRRALADRRRNLIGVFAVAHRDGAWRAAAAAEDRHRPVKVGADRRRRWAWTACPPRILPFARSGGCRLLLLLLGGPPAGRVFLIGLGAGGDRAPQ